MKSFKGLDNLYTSNQIEQSADTVVSKCCDFLHTKDTKQKAHINNGLGNKTGEVVNVKLLPSDWVDLHIPHRTSEQ